MRVYLHENFKKILLKENLTQRAFVKLIDVPYSYMFYWLNRKYGVSVKYRKKILETLKNYNYDNLFEVKDS